MFDVRVRRAAAGVHGRCALDPRLRSHDFQSGDSATLYRSVHEQIFTLPDETILYPAHDYEGRTSSSVREEKRWNPRLGGSRSAGEFARIMEELHLPYPRKIDTAVPANVHGGGARAEALSAAAELDRNWAPIELTLAGVPQLAPEWLHEHAGAAYVIDVREPDEYRGELGHVPGAALIPLAALRAAAHGLPRDRAFRARVPFGRALGPRCARSRPARVSARGVAARRNGGVEREKIAGRVRAGAGVDGQAGLERRSV